MIYLAASLKNHVIISQLAFALRRAGIECFVPHENTAVPTMAEGRTVPELSRLVFQNNLAALDACDAVIAIVHRIGTDTAWECGYATGRGKPVILLEWTRESIEEMYMVNESVPSSHRVAVTTFDASSFDSAIKSIKAALATIPPGHRS